MSFIYNLTDTWTDAGTTYSAIKMNVTNTASAAGSKLLDLQIGGTPFFTVDKTGGMTITRTGVTAPASTDGNVFSGTYTPTLTNSTNIDSSVAYTCQYMRVGNVVTVSGKVTIDATASGFTTLRMSLPISSNFATQQQCGGTYAAAVSTTANLAGQIYADATNDVAVFTHGNNITSAVDFFFSFTYIVI